MADQGSQLGPTEVVHSLDSPRSVPLDKGQNANTSSSDPFEGEQPEIQGLLEKVMELETEIQTAITSSKATTPKQAEIREPLKEIMKILVQQQVMIGHLMGRLSSETKENTFICTDFIFFPPFWSKG
ncbi:hypothetical protein AVEN_52678-1 [Araneus ventricosus]|uniref:Uncharacterized protein n=1 Tax=Araneus ventricosus TaxID=182803 RepID=A0A4Y2TLX4_ARAVE|nr:hypothetical protein AVEN_52678-1 [Araneus ventricosus]